MSRRISKTALASRLWRCAQVRAELQKVPFDLEQSDIVVPEYCPVLGLKIKHNKGPMADNSPTVDRIVPERGYVRDNIVVVSNRANRLKGDANLNEIANIASFYLQMEYDSA